MNSDFVSSPPSSGFNLWLSQQTLGAAHAKWLALVLGILLFFFLRPFVERLLIRIRQQKFFKDRDSLFFQIIFLKIERFVSWIIISVLAGVYFESLGMPLGLEKYLLLGCKIILAVNLIRICYLAAEAIGNNIGKLGSKNPLINDQLAPLATKTLKVFVIVVGTLIFLQNLGVDVTALLAGLGIGGVALAFAAQDTVANVFGTITILLDSPFKIGDRVRILDIDGFIEEVGFRSTTVRTQYNSLVTIPNSTVAKEKIDNLTLRNNNVRFRFTLGFTYSSPIENIKRFCELLQEYLRSHKNIDSDRILVNITEFAESSIIVLVSYHYKFEDLTLENKVQQDHLIVIAKLAEELKTEFAFPTRTLMMPPLQKAEVIRQ